MQTHRELIRVSKLFKQRARKYVASLQTTFAENGSYPDREMKVRSGKDIWFVGGKL